MCIRDRSRRAVGESWGYFHSVEEFGEDAKRDEFQISILDLGFLISKSEILKSEMTSQSLSKPTTADSYDRRIALFTIAWTLAAIILIVLTWRLWTGAAEFPQIPLLESLIRAPLIADWVALLSLIHI